jgi:hypothetical protein
VATAVVPQLAVSLGWKVAFYILGLTALGFACVWATFAQAMPETPERENKPAVGGNFNFNLNLPPARVAFAPSVWCCIVQHSCFNGSKYFFAAWAPLYFWKVFAMPADQSGLWLSPPQIVGALFPVVWGLAERHLLRRTSLLHSRRCFDVIGFVGSAACVLAMAWLHHTSSTTPAAVCLLLCVQAACITAHAAGFKSNYNEITVTYAGLLMGVGNTVATMATYAVPVVAAHVLERKEDNWPALLVSIACLNFVGLAAGCFTSVLNLDNDRNSSGSGRDKNTKQD